MSDTMLSELLGRYVRCSTGVRSIEGILERHNRIFYLVETIGQKRVSRVRLKDVIFSGGNTILAYWNRQEEWSV